LINTTLGGSVIAGAYLLFFVRKYNVLDFELIQFYFEISELPFGWEKVEDPHYGTYYIE